MSEACRIQLLYDGACPICSREVRWIGRRDRGGRIEMVDIAGEGFDASEYELSAAAVQAKMHAVVPGEGVLVGMEAKVPGVEP